MAILKNNTVSISQFFEFAKNSSNFELIDVISLANSDQNFSIEKNGYFEYRTSFLVDNEKIERYNVVGISFSICKENPDDTRLTKLENVVERFNLSLRENYDRLLNSAVSNILSNNASQGSTSTYNRAVKVVAGEIDDPNAPDSVDLSTTRNSDSRSDLKSLSNIARSRGEDPAKLASVGNTATKGLVSVAGQKSINSTYLKQNVGHYVSISSLRNKLRNLRRGNQDNFIVNSKLPTSNGGKKSGASTFEIIPKRRFLTNVFQISAAKISSNSKFYVLVEPIIDEREANNKLFSSTIIRIDHLGNLENFLLNPEPPDVSLAEATYYSASFKLTRNDPTLKSVRVTRIMKNSVMGKVSHQDMGEIFFSSDTMTFKDEIDNVKPSNFTYRFSVVNFNGTLGEFTSIVVPSFAKVADPLKTGSVPVSIRAINQADGIEVKVYTLVDDIFSLRLLRQEIGKTGNFDDSVTQISNTEGVSTILSPNTNQEINFFDNNAFFGKKYRYFIAYRRGLPGSAALAEELLSDEDETIIRRQYFGQLPFSISVTDPTVLASTSSSASVEMTVNAVETTELFNSVVEALKQAGIAGDFIAKLQSDDLKSKLFVMFLVERFDCETGRRSNFGFFPAGKFVDSPEIRQKLKIPSLSMGGKYSYIFKVCLLPPEIFLQTTSIGLLNESGIKFDKKAARFARQAYSKLGVMPPESEIQQGVSIEKILSESQIGLEIVKDVKLPSEVFKIENVRVSDGFGCANVTWKVSGNSQNVSYFLIYCAINGEENLLGAIAASSNSTEYLFKDDVYHNEVGMKSYRISAVTFDDDETVNSPIAKVGKSFSVPENLLIGICFSSIGTVNKIIPATQALEVFSKVSEVYSTLNESEALKNYLNVELNLANLGSAVIATNTYQVEQVAVAANDLRVTTTQNLSLQNISSQFAFSSEADISMTLNSEAANVITNVNVPVLTTISR